MKRTIAALALLAAAAVANAETITLPAVVCGTTRICTSAGVEIRANTMYPSVTVIIGADTYTSPTGGGAPYEHIGPLVLTQGDSYIILTADFSSHRKPGSGRLRGTTIWSLDGATIERP